VFDMALWRVICNVLVSLSTGIVLEAKGIKEHHWKPFIKQLFEKKVC